MNHTAHTRHYQDSRKRSRSPNGDEGYSSKAKHRHHGRSHQDQSPKAKLPFQSRHLDKRDYEGYKALFAEYLDLQKSLDIAELHEDEVKGRWKSFLGKWNRGELNEGWYDPVTKTRADNRIAEGGHIWRSDRTDVRLDQAKAEASNDNDVEDGYGPSLPIAEGDRKERGPAVPNFQDLQYRREQAEEDEQARKADLRHLRKQDRKVQKERAEELAPRAEPGTRERQLEKKRQVAASNKSFAEAKDAAVEEVGESDLFGDDGVEGYKARLKAAEKQKNEREVRKEEVLRARAAEREERLAVQRRKEEKTMEMLRGLAQQRFGGAGAGAGAGVGGEES